MGFYHNKNFKCGSGFRTRKWAEAGRTEESVHKGLKGLKESVHRSLMTFEEAAVRNILETGAEGILVMQLQTFSNTVSYSNVESGKHT